LDASVSYYLETLVSPCNGALLGLSDEHKKYPLTRRSIVTRIRAITSALVALVLLPRVAYAEATERVSDTGASALWLLANFSYAGMRAQNHPSAGWRVVAFIFGFPGTLLSYFLVPEGGERAYGVEIPRRPL
jgi:hypothetical protein